MGMSASQARYLQLTARKSDLEFQAQQICQKRLSLAERTQQIATKYSNQINDRHLYYNAPYTLQTGIDEDGNVSTLVNFGESSASQKRLDYYDITNGINDPNQPGLGYRIVNSEGKIVVPAIPEGANPDDYVVDASIVPNMSDSESAYRNACDYLEDKLRNAEWTLQKRNTNDNVDTGFDWVDTDFYTDSFIDDLLYEDNDSAAEAEYTRDTETIQSQDKALEMRLNQITTEQKAIETEMESVKNVIKKNVESSFKTFG